MLNEKAHKELEVIRERSGGLLHPEDVIDHARDPASELHKYFEWDDNEAAKEYRLIQARKVIKVAVIVEDNTQEKIKAYVKLDSDVKRGERGYRHIVEVLSDDAMRQEMLGAALQELLSFQNKYDKLRDVAQMQPAFKGIQETLKETA